MSRCALIATIASLYATAQADPTASPQQRSPASPYLVRIRPVVPEPLFTALIAPDYVLFQRDNGRGAQLVRLDASDGTETRVYETPGRFSPLDCDAAFARCVVEAWTQKTGTVTANAMPIQVLVIEGAQATVVAAGETRSLHPISPDGAWIVTKKFGVESVRLVARNVKTKRTVEVDGMSLDLVEWRKDGAAWVVILQDRDAPTGTKEWHLDGDGKVVASRTGLQTPPDDLRILDNRNLKVAKAGRTVALPTLACPWEIGKRVDDRYEELICGRRLGFVDTLLSVIVMPQSDGAIHIAPGGRYVLELDTHDGFIDRFEPPR
jgi:hypothetical protein